MPGLCMWCWGPNPELYAYKAGSLLPELHPQSENYNFKRLGETLQHWTKECICMTSEKYRSFQTTTSLNAFLWVSSHHLFPCCLWQLAISESGRASSPWNHVVDWFWNNYWIGLHRQVKFVYARYQVMCISRDRERSLPTGLLKGISLSQPGWGLEGSLWGERNSVDA